jgi:predicted aspartyl protease
METSTMGRVVVPARIENMGDLLKVEEGTLSPDAVRKLDVPDALVDTGATYLCIPAKLIQKLGLSPARKRRVRTAAGLTDVAVYHPVRLTVQGRDCMLEVAAIADDCPVLIGQVPLEMLDFVVDPKGQRLIGNPEHGGEQMIELFTFLPGSAPGT